MIRIKLPNVIQGLTDRAFGVFSAEVNRKYRRNENECLDASRWICAVGRARYSAGARGGGSGRKRCRYGSFCVMASIAGTPCFPGVPTGLDEISGPRGPARLARGRSSGFALLRDYLSYSCGFRRLTSRLVQIRTALLSKQGFRTRHASVVESMVRMILNGRLSQAGDGDRRRPQMPPSFWM